MPVLPEPRDIDTVLKTPLSEAEVDQRIDEEDRVKGRVAVTLAQIEEGPEALRLLISQKLIGSRTLSEISFTPVGYVLDTEETILLASGLYSDALLCIVHLDGQNYIDAVDAINDLGGSTSAAVGHLSQWDQGVETDRDAAVYANYSERREIEEHAHHPEERNDIHYWLIADHMLGHYTLYRRPLT